MNRELIFVVVIVGFFFLVGLLVFGLFVRVWRKEQQAEKTVIEQAKREDEEARK